MRAWMLFGSILSCGTALAAKPAGLQPGYYTNVHVVVSASATGPGQCTDQPGAIYLSATYYPGPSKPGFTDWRAFSSAAGQAEIITGLPVTPPANQPNWSGTYTITVQPGGTPFTGTFNTNTVYADAHSTVSTSTYTYPAAGGGTCTTMQRSNMTPSGK